MTVIPILLVISFFRSLEAELYSVVERITPLEDELELAELDLLPLVIPLIIPLIAPPAPPVIPPIIPPINAYTAATVINRAIFSANST